LRKFL